MNKISVKSINKAFQGPILQNVSFDAYTGNIISLLGKSGSGKSTLLRCLAQLETPDSGQIELFGLQVGMVFQQFHLWKHMTVLENLITAPMHVLGLSKKEAIKEALQLLEQFQLQEKRYEFPLSLSGGEQQRVAIARALMMRPDILLFDEPTSALDPDRTHMVGQLIQQLAKQDLIILMATHDHHFSKWVSNRVFTLENGQLEEI